MTIMVAEAAPGAVAEAEGAVSASGASRAASAPSARPKVSKEARERARQERAKAAAGQRARTRAARERDRAARGVGPYASPAPAPAKRGSGQVRGFAEGYAADSARKVRSHGKRSLSFKATKGDYHKVVAAEFLFAIAVVTVAPIVTPGSGSASTGPSPYGRQDITRLAGVFTLFFILALVSHGRPGKMAVAFGFLVDLGVLFRASQRGALKGIGSAFGSKGTGTKASSGGGGGAPPGGAVA